MTRTEMLSACAFLTDRLQQLLPHCADADAQRVRQQLREVHELTHVALYETIHRATAVQARRIFQLSRHVVDQSSRLRREPGV